MVLFHAEVLAVSPAPAPPATWDKLTPSRGGGPYIRNDLAGQCPATRPDRGGGLEQVQTAPEAQQRVSSLHCARTDDGCEFHGDARRHSSSKHRVPRHTVPRHRTIGGRQGLPDSQLPGTRLEAA